MIDFDKLAKLLRLARGATTMPERIAAIRSALVVARPLLDLARDLHSCDAVKDYEDAREDQVRVSIDRVLAALPSGPQSPKPKARGPAAAASAAAREAEGASLDAMLASLKAREAGVPAAPPPEIRREARWTPSPDGRSASAWIGEARYVVSVDGLGDWRWRLQGRPDVGIPYPTREAAQAAALLHADGAAPPPPGPRSPAGRGARRR